MHYPQVLLYRKILYGLLVPNLLFGAYLLYAILRYDFDFDFIEIFLTIIGLSISIFYLVLLITLINYVEYLELRVGQLQTRLLHLDEDISQASGAPLTKSSPAQSERSLSRRIGKL